MAVFCSSVVEEEDEGSGEKRLDLDGRGGKLSQPVLRFKDDVIAEKLLDAVPDDGHDEFLQPELQIRNLEILQITPTSVQVQLPAITGGNLMYIEEILYKQRSRDGKDDTTNVPWDNSIIHEGNKIFTLTGLRAKTAYRLRWQAPNKHPYQDVLVSTKEYDEKPPKVIISERTHDEVTLSFDDFAPADYRHGIRCHVQRGARREMEDSRETPFGHSLPL